MTPTATLRAALAAYRPDVPRWQQQRRYAALTRATATLAEKIAEWEVTDGENVGKLTKMEQWLDANPEHPEHDANEERWMTALARYTAARDLLGEAELAMAGKERE